MSISSGWDHWLGLDVVTMSLYLYQPRVLTYSPTTYSQSLGNGTTYSPTTYSQ